MANNAYIIEHEKQIMDCEGMLESLTNALRDECLRNLPRDGSCSNGHPDSVNRDCWATLLLNARSLQRQLTKTIKELEQRLPGV